MLKNLLILLLTCLLGWRLWRTPPPPAVAEPLAMPEKPALQRLIEAAAQQPGLVGAAIGFCLLDEQGVVVAAHQARTAFIPASTLKTVTTATALERLGPGFQMETRLCSTMPMVDGVVMGDVMVVGGADPMLSLKDLQGWAEVLKERGLRRISGRVLGDGRLLRGSLYDDFWNWGDIGNGYGSAVAGLNLEHNRFVATFRAGASVGASTLFRGAFPEVPEVAVVNETLTGAAESGDGVVIHGGERTGLLHFRGTVPLGAEAFQVTGAVPDPELYAAHHFRRALLAAGIEVVGDAAAVGKAEVGTHELLKHRSPRLQDIVTSIHATSDNHETECVFRHLGLEAGKPPEDVIREHWRARGLDFTGLRLEDGCGLARADFITPHDLARLQFLAGKGPQGAVYKASLLQQGALRWKGGAMSGVRSTTGYVTADSGREFCFAFMANHYSDGQAVARLRDAVIDAIRRQ